MRCVLCCAAIRARRVSITIDIPPNDDCVIVACSILMNYANCIPFFFFYFLFELSSDISLDTYKYTYSPSMYNSIISSSFHFQLVFIFIWSKHTLPVDIINASIWCRKRKRRTRRACLGLWYTFLQLISHRIRVGFDHCLFIDLPLFRFNGAAICYIATIGWKKIGIYIHRKRIDIEKHDAWAYKIIRRVKCVLSYTQ